MSTERPMLAQWLHKLMLEKSLTASRVAELAGISYATKDRIFGWTPHRISDINLIKVAKVLDLSLIHISEPTRPY